MTKLRTALILGIIISLVVGLVLGIFIQKKFNFGAGASSNTPTTTTVVQPATFGDAILNNTQVNQLKSDIAKTLYAQVANANPKAVSKSGIFGIPKAFADINTDCKDFNVGVVTDSLNQLISSYAPDAGECNQYNIGINFGYITLQRPSSGAGQMAIFVDGTISIYHEWYDADCKLQHKFQAISLLNLYNSDGSLTKNPRDYYIECKVDDSMLKDLNSVGTMTLGKLDPCPRCNKTPNPKPSVTTTPKAISSPPTGTSANTTP